MTGMRKRFALYALVFIVCCAAGIAWSISRSGTRPADLLRLRDISFQHVLLLVFWFVATYFTDALRYRWLAWTLGIPLSWKTAIDTSLASFFFSWISPGAILGGPAALFILGTGGVPWDFATLLAFGKGFFGTVVLLMTAFLVLACGIGPVLPATLQLTMAGGALLFGLFGLFFLIAGLAPRPASAFLSAGFKILGPRLAGLSPRLGHLTTAAEAALTGAVEKLGHFGKRGLSGLMAILLSNFLYFAAFIGTAVTLLHAFGAPSLLRATGASIVYLGFIYVAPTPGGAGLAEAGISPFFAGVLPGAQAVVPVLLFRVFTIYLQIFTGFWYFLLTGRLWSILDFSTNAPSGKHD
jgi:hypothetical protein